MGFSDEALFYAARAVTFARHGFPALAGYREAVDRR
jgi:hypothetical protein